MSESKAPAKRRAVTLTVEAVSEAIRASCGMLRAAARRLCVSTATLSKFLARHPNLQDEMDDQAHLGVELAIINLRRALVSNDPKMVRWATTFMLTHRGAEYGFGPKLELSGSVAVLRLDNVSDEQLRRLAGLGGEPETLGLPPAED